MNDEFICGSSVTGKYVIEHLKTHFGPNAQLESFEAQQIGVGEGVVSHILRLRLKWTLRESVQDLPESIIVKVPTLGHAENIARQDSKSGEQGDMLVDLMTQWVPIGHNVECRVYEMFEKNPPIDVPRCYALVQIKDGCKDPGMIIMEDMSIKAGTSPSFLDGLSYKQALASFESMARLQAWCLTTDIDWRSRIPSIEDLDAIMRTYVGPAPLVVPEMMAKYPDILGSIEMEKVKEIMTIENAFGIWNEHRAVMDDVFVHGDFHKNNVLFEKNEDGKVSDRLAAVIDLQTSMRGPPTYDLARLMAFSVTQEFRAKYEMELLHRYYDLTKSIAGDKFKPTFDHICRWYYRCLAIESILLILWIPVIMGFAVKTEGDQKKKDERQFLEEVFAGYQHGVKNYYSVECYDSELS